MARKEKMKVYHGLPSYAKVGKNTIAHIDFGRGFKGKGIAEVIDSRNNNASYMSAANGVGSEYGVYISNANSAPGGTRLILKLDKTHNISEGFSMSTIIKTKDLNMYSHGVYVTKIDDFSAPNLSSVPLVSLLRPLGFAHDTSNPERDRLSISYYDSEGTSKDITTTLAYPTNTYIFIQTIFKDNVLSVYVNGVLERTSPVPSLPSLDYNAMVISFPSTSQGKIYMDDIIITTNTDAILCPLPQDYIDGKATISPRLGHTQVVGDARFTEDTVDTISCTNPSNNEPWVVVTNATKGQWKTGDTIKIQSIDNSIITGVLDVDTAICKIESVTEGGKIGVNFMSCKVNTVSGLNVDDILKLQYSTGVISTIANIKVTNIDTVNKIIRLEFNANLGSDINVTAIGAYIFEITASSSSPVVINEDKAAQIGTWSGLGTSEAVFTLGATIANPTKDLFVAYSLTSSNLNSHFPGIPYDVIRGYTEHQIEAKPVTDIIIADDFKSKLKSNIKNCPHVSKWLTSSTYQAHDSVSWNEMSDTEYSNMSQQDGNSVAVTTTGNNQIPQHLFTFDLISIVERKLGTPIPSNDKVQWLKDNVDKIWFNHYGYGVNPSGSLLHCQIGANYFSTFEWQGIVTNTNHFHTGSTFTLLRSVTIDGYASNKISKEGKVNFIVHTKPSNAPTQSSIYTKYAFLEVRLKKDAQFTVLFSENNRAREDECNPILIQKETKTVRRYLPSKEPFITECSYEKLFYSQVEGNVNIPAKGLVRSNYVGLTNYGTSEPRTVSPGGGDKYTPLISKLPINSRYKSNMFIRGRIPHRYSDSILQFGAEAKGKLPYLKFPIIADGAHYTNIDFFNEGRIGGYGEHLDANYAMAARFIGALVQVGGELMLKIRTVVPNSPDIASGVQVPMGENYDAEALYQIPGRPLIK